MKRPYEMSWSFGPGAEVVERRMRAIREAERPNYAATTERLWADAWGPPRPPGNGVLTAAFNAAAEYASQKQPARHSAVPTR